MNDMKLSVKDELIVIYRDCVVGGHTFKNYYLRGNPISLRETRISRISSLSLYYHIAIALILYKGASANYVTCNNQLCEKMFFHRQYKRVSVKTISC
jgi:hypothetical protein